MAFLPYLNFGTTTRDAFTRYHEIFGGELTLLRMSDLPPGQMPADANPDLIMHAALLLGDDMLMASDTGDPDFAPVHGMYTYWSTPDEAEARRVFAALSEGGQVEMPIEPTFWAKAFGACRDRFGTQWMISADAPADAGG